MWTSPSHPQRVVWEKAAALLLSFVRNRALVDGNKRMGFTAAVLFLRKNDMQLSFDEDEAYDLVIAVAERRLTEVAVVVRSCARGDRVDRAT